MRTVFMISHDAVSFISATSIMVLKLCLQTGCAPHR